jgi:RNA polymerase sigma-32 factor
MPGTRDSFRLYLEAIERYPVPTAAAERSLAQRFAAGDPSAGNRLVCANLRYVVPLARRLRGYGLPLPDLVAEGNLGLLEAARRFDPERGVALRTYARHFIRARMLAFVRRTWSVVGLDHGVLSHRLFFALPRERARLLARVGEPAEVTRSLAERFGIDEAELQAFETRIDRRDCSLSQPERPGADPLVEQMPAAGPDAEAQALRRQSGERVRRRVAATLAELSDRERLIAELRFLGEGSTTLTDLGRRLGVSRERVRQLEARVRGKLQESLGDLEVAASAA